MENGHGHNGALLGGRVGGVGGGGGGGGKRRTARPATERVAEAEARARIAKANAEAAAAGLRSRMIGAASGHAVMLGGYASARRDRLRPGKAHTERTGAADFHRDRYTLQELRKKTQAADRNDELVRGLIQTLIGLVNCDGYTLQAETKDDAWNEENEAAFNAWAGDGDATGTGGAPAPGACDIRGLNRLEDMAAENIRAACVDGDLGYLLIDDGPGRLQPIEAERIVNPRGTLTTGRFRDGVEVDAAGRPVRFHIAEWAQGGVGSFAELGTTRAVDARHVLFLRNPLRMVTGATRGEPQLAASLQRLEDLAGFDEASRIAARVQACFAVYIRKNDPSAAQSAFAGEAAARASDGGDERRAEIEPGMMNFMLPNEEVQGVGPTQPGPAYGEFVTMQVLRVCCNLGLPLTLGMLDARMANLSTTRSVLQVAWRNFLRWQAWQTCWFYSPVYTWFTARRIRAGETAFREDWARHSFVAPPPPVMDPKTEIEALGMAVDKRFMSRGRAMRMGFGTIPRREWPEIERQEKELEDRGIPAAKAPGATDGPGAGAGTKKQPNAEGPEGPEGAEEDGGVEADPGTIGAAPAGAAGDRPEGAGGEKKKAGQGKTGSS